MGRRHADSEFMPGYYVFPGGAVERADRAAVPASPLDLAHLAAMGVGGNARTAVALGVAAVRETFEETGIMVADPGDVGNAPARPSTRCAAAASRRRSGASSTSAVRSLPPTPHPVPRAVLPRPPRTERGRARRRRRAARPVVGAARGPDLAADHRDHPLHGAVRRRRPWSRPDASREKAGVLLPGPAPGAALPLSGTWERGRLAPWPEAGNGLLAEGPPNFKRAGRPRSQDGAVSPARPCAQSGRPAPSCKDRRTLRRPQGDVDASDRVFGMPGSPLPSCPPPPGEGVARVHRTVPGTASARTASPCSISRVIVESTERAAAGCILAGRSR